MAFWAAIPAIASVAGDILGGIMGSEAADDISDAQRDSSQQQIDLAKLIYGDQRALNAPARAAGNAALEQALGLTGLSFQRGADIEGAFSGGGGGGATGAGGSFGGPPDFNAYMAAPGNEDLVQAWRSLSPAVKADLKRQGYNVDNPAEFGRWHYENNRHENRAARIPQQPLNIPQAPGAPGTPATGAAQTPTQVLQQTPGYQFRMDEGRRAVDAGFSRGGAINSGARAKALTQYGQNFATNEMDSQFARLMNIIAPGSAAVGATSGAGSAYADRVSGAIDSRATGDAYSSAYGANSFGNMVSGVADTIGSTDWGSIFNRGKPAMKKKAPAF